jgi:integrase/recombinase XerC
VDGDPLLDAAARDWAVRDYRSHLQTIAKTAPSTVGHARLETTRAYTRPTAEDREKALDLLPVDR